jgi:hypothetical protein
MATEDQKTNAELIQIRDELAEAEGERRQRLMRAYVETAHNGNQAGINEIGPLAVEYVRQMQGRYPSMMDVCDGIVEKAAGMVVGLMLMHATDGLAISIGEACDVCEEIAANMVNDLVPVNYMTFTVPKGR